MAQFNGNQPSVDQSYLSFDTDNVLDLDTPLELGDDELLTWSDDQGYQVSALITDTLNRHADLTGFSVFNGAIGFTFDTTISISDGSPNNLLITITSQEIGMASPGPVTLPFDPDDMQFSKLTVPALENSSSQIDALSSGYDDGFLMSLDRTTLLDGITSLTVRPADVFSWEQSTNSYTLLFDASLWFSMAQLPGMNVSAISWDPTRELLYLSFDTAGRTTGSGSLSFEANSILVFNPENNTLLIWDVVGDELADAGLSKGAKLNAMMLTFIKRQETIFTDGFE